MNKAPAKVRHTRDKKPVTSAQGESSLPALHAILICDVSVSRAVCAQFCKGPFMCLCVRIYVARLNLSESVGSV